MDTELISEIRIWIDKVKNFRELNKSEAFNAVEAVAKKYIGNRNQTWWWESLKHKSVTIKYDDSDGLMLLEKIVGNDNAEVIFVVTDDEPEPWAVFQGNFRSIIQVISEQRFFEYFITDQNYSWLIFDTHHNSLVVIGDLLEVAEKKLQLK